MEELQKFTIGLTVQKKVSYKSIINYFNNSGSIENLFEGYQKKNIPNLEIDNIAINEVVKNLDLNGIQSVCFWEKTYPILLRECYDFPLVIYYKGNVNLLKRKDFVSIVGSRKITSYGKGVLQRLIPSIKDSVVVSGLAYGVDAYAHLLAIDSGLNTIAVLPSSVDQITPVANEFIYNKILESNNLVISEFSPFSPLHSGLFPRRNRIIAGLSQKTVVIEAALKSGALITANLAFDYNREVFAVPGNINSPMSQGCNLLIKNNIAKILDSHLDLQENSVSIDMSKLSELETKVYYAILAEPKNLNTLVQELKLNIDLIINICTKLEISGILNTDSQNKYYVT